MSFFLSGVDKIYLVDITFLISKKRLETTFHKFMECRNSGYLQKYITILPERLDVLENIMDDIDKLTMQEILRKLNIVYLIEDARKLSLPDNSIDLVSSNNTFEHIYPGILIPILKEFKRIVKKQGGIMFHFIDMSDHFAHFDKSIYHL